MKEIKGSVMILAPSEKVWATMTDFSSYPEWNPWLKRMAGELKVSSIYEVKAHPPGKEPTEFKAKVMRIEDGREVLFHGKFMGGLVKDAHLFTVDRLDAGRSIFFQSVVFSGPLAGLAGSTIEASKKGLEEMNAALKKRCEEGR